jgi:hypothetical protein
MSALQVVLGGALVFASGILIGSAQRDLQKANFCKSRWSARCLW